jgi:RNA polymerase sigma-70 factor (ECF subfamily)
MDRRGALATDDDVRAVYAAHGGELYRFARRALGDSGLAEEAVQEAFLRAWQAADRFDDQLGSLRTWLFAILRNVVIDLSRARAVRPRLAAVDHSGQEPTLDLASAESIESVLVTWQVEEALGKISPEHRVALVEVHIKGRSYAEVATEMGVPAGTVKSRVFYGLKSLRLALEELGWNAEQ